MISLPNHIWNEIFVHLHQIDKTECMLVCQTWKQIIKEFSLYHAIILYSISNVKKLTEKIQETPDIAKKIQQLNIVYDNADEYNTDLDAFLALLPNLRALFSSIRASEDEDTSMIFNKTNTQYTWKGCIEYVYERHHTDSRFYHILSSYTCPNLSTLKIHIDERTEIIPILRNAPSLKYVTIIDGSIDFDILTAIHTNAPCLESLTLQSVDMNGMGFSADNIIPSTSVTQFMIRDSNINSSTVLSDLLIYISKKYPNLSKLDFNEDYYGQFLNEEEYMDLSGWTFFFQNVGPHLKELCFDFIETDMDYFFGLMERSKPRIDSLALYTRQPEKMTEAITWDRIRCIQTLVLDGLEEGQSYECLSELYVLKKLELSGIYIRDINIKNLLVYCTPTLQSLSLKRFNIKVDLDYTGEFLLESLRLESVQISKNLDTFIACHFPKLSKLQLHFCSTRGKTFDISKINLSKFIFKDRFPPKVYNVLVKTYRHNEACLYTVKNGLCYNELPYDRPYKVYPGNETDAVIHFTLCCNSLKTVVFK